MEGMTLRIPIRAVLSTPQITGFMEFKMAVDTFGTMYDLMFAAIRSMIETDASELAEFASRCQLRRYGKGEVLGSPGKIPDAVYFIGAGLVRVAITDRDGDEHTIHFALEGQFISDYSAFMTRQASVYTLTALEPVDAVVLTREAIDWGYRHMREGQKLGRRIAEFYFIYQDARIRNQYLLTPKERYDGITSVFPDIHNRAPQHMIASYLGITSVHLSRLKRAAARKL